MAKLRAKYKIFQLLKFEEYQFDTSQRYHTWYSDDISCYSHYLWLKFINRIFQAYAPEHKKLLNSTYDVFNNELSFKLIRQEVNDLENLDVNVNVVKDLVNKISDLSKITLGQRNFFLHNEINDINHTFLMELNMKIQICDLISTNGIGLRSAELVTPESSLKFNVLEKKYKEKLVLQLEDTRRYQKLDVKDKKIIKFSILLSSKKKKDELKIVGLQTFDRYEKLNPVEISIKDSEINTFLYRFRRYKYCLRINNLLFSSSLAKETNVIFVSCNGLTDAKETIVNAKSIKVLGVVNINQIESWDKLKGKKKWVNVLFNNSDLEPMSSKHFAFEFITTNLHNLLNFEYSLLDDIGKLITFQKDEDKVPVLNFTIQIIT